MKETVLGVIVLGLIVAGVFWTRSRTVPPSDGGLQAPSAAGRASMQTDTDAPDVTLADGIVDLAGARVVLSVSPRPPAAFTRERFRVRVESAGQPLALEGGRISFEMTMPMGDHRYALVEEADGWYGAEVVLPFCKSGNPRWYAIVEGTAGGRPLAARFRLDLTKPESRSG